ncbi:actin [Schistosoma japonicum]|uniref:Actin n=2 Tax=Schistosoma japonicum TaxID=6182 RepID=C1L3T0_SCHJA|nr:Actin, gamma [Schistosoma japonicum]KAH8872879.1 Actin, gamma [Schistosoma japonicum]KAH8872880.1 Actin, gamma [Schistosoma japonicum]KAH8872881.1 Actin, gamma [Schistosoma japonicum]TNN05571.1 actin [Schistosoma japonicum]
MSLVEDWPIVVDNGAGHLKAGYAGDGGPRILVPMLIGRPKKCSKYTDWFVGEHANAIRNELILNCPIANGIVTDIDGLSLVWYYMFMKELRTSPENHPVLISEYPLLPKFNREKLAEMVFEKFHMPGLYFTDQSALALYAYGLTSGIVVDIGTEMSNITPVNNTLFIPNATRRQNFGGSHITELFRYMLAEEHPGAATSMSREFVRLLKEKFCFISMNPDEEKKQMNSSSNTQNVHRTPDGHVIRLTKERFMAPELLFYPRQAGLIGTTGLQNAINESIQKCPSELQSTMYSNIVLSGGSTLFPGFSQRLEHELRKLNSSTNRRILVHKKQNDQKYAVWIGGSILASLSSFKEIYIKKKEYDECGAGIVHTR